VAFAISRRGSVLEQAGRFMNRGFFCLRNQFFLKSIRDRRPPPNIIFKKMDPPKPAETGHHPKGAADTVTWWVRNQVL
jgi:hypothetical protein